MLDLRKAWRLCYCSLSLKQKNLSRLGYEGYGQIAYSHRNE